MTKRSAPKAVEQKRPEVAAVRQIWITRRQPSMANMLTRIGFIDETSVKTNMAKIAGLIEPRLRVHHAAPRSTRSNLSVTCATAPPAALSATAPALNPRRVISLSLMSPPPMTGLSRAVMPLSKLEGAVLTPKINRCTVLPLETGGD